MTTKRDYNKTLVKAAKMVLLEITHVLGAYRGDIVVIGGLTPSLILSEANEPHIGSIDVDLLVNHQRVDERAYAQISDLLIERGYERGDNPSRFIREVTLEGQVYRVPVDFLAGAHGGTSDSHRHQQASGIRLRKVRGGDLATRSPLEIQIQGTLPGGGEDSATCRVVEPAMFLFLKALAIRDRLKEKDAYDLYYMLRHYAGGIDKLVEECKPYLREPVVIEAMQILADKFASPDHVGPRSVADFEEIQDEETRMILQRDVYERVVEIVRKLEALN